MRKAYPDMLLRIAGTFIYLAAAGFFYFKYVPLVPAFQKVLVPLLALSAFLTAANPWWGLLFFVFVFPLINNLPYFFGINESIPHAPTALVLFFGFFLGWLAQPRGLRQRRSAGQPLFKPLLFLASLILLSGVITFFRYTNYFPFWAERIRELIVNTREVRAGGALMSVVFCSLNYLSGILFFFILWTTVKTKKAAKELMAVLSVSALLSLAFSFVQRYHSMALGNLPFWASQSRINGTFKDPNSLALFLAAFSPVFLGLALSSKKSTRAVYLLLTLLLLWIFPAVGSRSGLLALLVALAAFILLATWSQRGKPKKRDVFVLSAFLIFVIFIILVAVFFGDSILSSRISRSLHLVGQENSWNEVFAHRLHFWRVACSMIRDYPLTGVGVGAYIVELPNYSKILGLPFRYTDSAENYLLQTGSELGLIGFLAAAWLLFELARVLRRGVRSMAEQGRDSFVLIGIFSGLLVYFMSFLFHSYIGSFEAKYLFWLLVTCFIVFSNASEVPDRRPKASRTVLMTAGITLVVFAGIHTWNSVHSLSISDQTRRFGWKQNFGLYKLEKDDQGNPFFWMKRSAGFTLEKRGSVFKATIRASHPDIRENPVLVRVYSADPYFRRKALLKDIVLQDSRWLEVEFPVREMPQTFRLVFETGRDWQPQQSLGLPDSRRLAIALARARFQ
jgi:O-antigen ligase